MIYNSEESKDEVQSINEDTRSGNMRKEVEGDSSVFEFRGKNQRLNIPEKFSTPGKLIDILISDLLMC